MAFQLYAGDNKGYFPRAGVPQAWMLSIRDYIPSRNNIVIDKVFLCPSAPQPPDGYASSAFHYSASFALENGNSATALDGEGTSGQPAAGPRTVNSIIKPARTILIVDGVVDSTTFRANSSRSYTLVAADLARNGPDANGFTSLSFRHGSSMNAAFVDGHVAKIAWGDRLQAIPDIYAWNGKQ